MILSFHFSANASLDAQYSVIEAQRRPPKNTLYFHLVIKIPGYLIGRIYA